MWCEMVGWVRPRPAVKSHTQMGDAALHREATIVRRVGSPNAFISEALVSAQSSLTRGSSQQTPRSRITGSCLTATSMMLHYPSTIIDGFRSMDTMGEIKEAVRSRYANAAKLIAVLPVDSTAGCCAVDGPDCGCAGSYPEAELKEIGLTDSVSLGCGNPTMLADLKPGEVVLALGSGAGLAG